LSGSDLSYIDEFKAELFKADPTGKDPAYAMYRLLLLRIDQLEAASVGLLRLIDELGICPDKDLLHALKRSILPPDIASRAHLALYAKKN
jgi:hypothetical protein